MTVPELTPTSTRTSPFLSRLPVDGVGWWIIVLACSALTAKLTMTSIQLGCAAALVILTLGLYAYNRTAGLVAMWAIWLVAPGLRRVFFLSSPIIDTDPLALAPFLATALLAGIEITQGSISKRARRILYLVLAGYLIGMPFGLLKSPPASAFAFFAYLTAAGCFVIGYRDGGNGRKMVLPTVLMAFVPLLALYAFRQYFLTLPQWDEVWFKTAEINSAGSPDAGRIRVWSTLNSPGTFGLVCSVATIAFVSVRRLTPAHVAGALFVIGALALTYARSAWAGLVFAILVIALVSRGAALKRVLVLGALLVVAAPIAFSGSAGAALTDRVSTFGTLGSDESAQARQTTPLQLLPVAVAQPLGLGVGQAGEATRLQGTGFRYTDNGYLSLMFQVGPFGFLLVMTAFAMTLRSAWRSARRRPNHTDILACGMLAFFFLTLFAGDQLYGVLGMFLWYAGGVAVRRDEIKEAAPQ